MSHAFICLNSDLLRVLLWVNHHYSPPFGRICLTFSKRRTSKSKEVFGDDVVCSESNCLFQTLGRYRCLMECMATLFKLESLYKFGDFLQINLRYESLSNRL